MHPSPPPAAPKPALPARQSVVAAQLARLRPAGRILLPFAAGYYVSYLFRSVNAVIAPELARELGAGPAELGFLTSTYFLSFAAAQIPVGVALDRYGPRRVVGGLLLLAALGAVIFARGHDLATLAIGRGLIGLGVSACLMGGLKAFSLAFSPERQASATGLIMAAGAFGALSASLPVEWLLPVWGWRGSLAAVAVMSLLAAIAIALVVPHPLGEPIAAGPSGALGGILRARAFWRYAPQALLFTGGYMALQGLWAGPWMIEVEGRTRTGAALGLALLNLGAFVGQLGTGLTATALARRGLARTHMMAGGLLTALACAAVLVAGAGFPGGARGSFLANALWFGFGFFGAQSAQVYGVTAEAFSPAISARVSTAINQFAFVGAFGLQWGIGGAIELAHQLGLGPGGAYRSTFAVLLALQVAAVTWAAVGGEKASRRR